MDGLVENKKFSLDKRCCYFLVFCVIILPLVTGIVVWYLTDSACEDSNKGSQESVTTTTPTYSESPTASVETTVNPAEPWRNLRLPHFITPIHYDITLYPNFYENNGWFYGNETVELNITQSTRYTLIHANYLNITKTELTDLNGQNLAIERTFWYEENQFWVIEVETPLPVSRVYLHLQFDGSLTREIYGFYKSTYFNSETQQTRHLASSKFQPVDARRAFPCFDEPNIKAEYTVTLVHKDGYFALSNMPETVTDTWDHDSSLQATHFERSVPMSTYLVCFVVCDFKNLTDVTKYGTQIRVFAAPDRFQQAAYSLHVMKMSMERYQDLFKVPFPLPKNDMIAIPNFVSGAMEHWGLIGYRETNMLYDATQASAANKQRVAVVVAHEIAHMWFGNIVTMDWWDDLWLNEGFASFVEYLGVDYTEPEWEMMDQMVVDDVKPVMVTDAGMNSHPIVVPVSHPNQITEVFDAISYSKGASILRMLQEMLGSDPFFDGISTYLTKYRWSTATTDDLWADLGQVPAGYTVKEVMDTWTLQMGLPYINITFDNSGPKTVVTATQSRFLANGNMHYDENESPFRYRWFVQLNYLDNNEYKINWIEKDQDSVTFEINQDMSQADSLIKFNVNETGFYRVNYPDNTWRKIANILETQGPSAVPYPADRTGLVDDAFNLARGGYISYDVALEITKYLDQEEHHLPWDSAYSGITYLKNMFMNIGKFDYLRKYFVKKVRPVLDHLTWEDGDSHLDKGLSKDKPLISKQSNFPRDALDYNLSYSYCMDGRYGACRKVIAVWSLLLHTFIYDTKLMRSNIIRLACDFAEDNCLGNATQKFRNWIDNDEFISPNIRTYVYKYGMSSAGTESDWNFMWDKYLLETVPQEKIKLLYGLANTKHVWLLNRYLDYCKDLDKIRAQDTFTVLTYISRNPVGNPLAWDWVRSNWDYLVDRFSLYNRYLGRLVPTIITNYNSQFKLQEAEDFFRKYPDAGAGARAREQARESIQRNIDWVNRNADNVQSWLVQNV